MNASRKKKPAPLSPAWFRRKWEMEGYGLWSEIIRGSKFFINKKKIGAAALLNVGCGPNVREEFINLDRKWRPGMDICWDITRKPYPLAGESLEGIYTEHCLEHIPFEDCRHNLKEFYRMLRPGGVLRIVVPDLELYIDAYVAGRTDPSVLMPIGEGEYSRAASLNRIMRSFGHRFIYDFETMRRILEEAGFRKIQKLAYGEGNDERLLIDTEHRKVESLYVEAVK